MPSTLIDLSRIEQPKGFVVAALGLLSVRHEWLRLPAEAWDEDASRLSGALIAATKVLAGLLWATADEAKPDLARLTLARGIVATHVSHAHAWAVRDALKAGDRESEWLRHREKRDRTDARAVDDAVHVLRRRAIERLAERDPRQVVLARELEAIAQGVRAQADEHVRLIAALQAAAHAREGGGRKRPRDLLRDAVAEALPRLADTQPRRVAGFVDALAQHLLGGPEDEPAAEPKRAR